VIKKEQLNLVAVFTEQREIYTVRKNGRTKRETLAIFRRLGDILLKLFDKLR